jgi:hypothetical protein
MKLGHGANFVSSIRVSSKGNAESRESLKDGAQNKASQISSTSAKDALSDSSWTMCPAVACLLATDADERRVRSGIVLGID